jgi:DNA-binding SARP family transcriptional activator
MRTFVLEFRILGPLEVLCDGRGLPLGRRHERILLALLVLSANRVVSSERLAEDLWGGAPPPTAASALRVHVSRLRRVLGQGGDADVLVTCPPGYLLRLEDDAVDARRFEILAALGRQRAAAGNHAGAAEALRQALSLWRGPALAEFVDRPFAQAEAVRLEEARLRALEDRVEADLGVGRHGELVGELEGLVRTHPLREGFWRQLMTALYRSGRPAEALRAYQRLRGHLGEELGIEPSQTLQRLERAMLLQEEWLEPAPPTGSYARFEDRPATGVSIPFVGRQDELSRLVGLLDEAVAARGGLIFIVGEPGIGKTRLAEELAGVAKGNGFSVLWGHCLDGDWAPPYAPFAEAVEALIEAVEPEQLRVDLGAGGPALAQLLPALRQRLPELPDAAPVQPDEERFRLLDAVAQLLVARSRRAPVLVCLEDLHWADRSTVAMLRHVARVAPGHCLLVAGTYRDDEVGAGHPLHEALGSLRREVEFERLKLEGLEAKAVAELLEALAERDVLGSVAAAIAVETDGNPFFIKELLRHLLEEGRFVRGPDGRWTSDCPVAELGIPEGVREVIDRRLARLSADVNTLLSAASVFEGEIRLGVVAAVAGMDEDAALDALDEALGAQLLAPAGSVDVYAFTHALIRHTLAGELSPSRRARLHLRAADALATAAGAEVSVARAGEIASQYHRAVGLPGAERGVELALAAAGHAEATGAHDEAARFLRMAIDLLPAGDSGRPPLLGRLGIALAWALAFDDAVAKALEAGQALLEDEGTEAAFEYLAEAAYACGMAGSSPHAWLLARPGLGYAGHRRDVAWARLVSYESERRAAEDDRYPGIPLDTPERRESARILHAAHLDPLSPAPMEAVYASRAEAITSTNLVVLTGWAGEYARCVPLLAAEAEAALGRGQLARAARCWSFLTINLLGLGRLHEARDALEQAQVLAARVGQPMFVVLGAKENLALALDEGWEELADSFRPLSASVHPANSWALAYIYGASARIAARVGETEEALRFLRLLVPWMERAPAWTVYFNVMACHAADVLWLLDRLDHVELVERSVREKVVAPDFRYPMEDGRLALARLCAVQGRDDEALSWLAEARRVLTEQGARPLRAIADFDEAVMYFRRTATGDLARARHLLNSARRQFEEVGMTGWIRKAQDLSKRLV